MSESTSKELQGQCLCGAVTLRLQREGEAEMSACHCGICRRWTGGPFLTLECHREPVIEGMEHVGIYNSSEWAQRGFCTKCGTHLFYRLKEGAFYALSAGLFSESGSWPFTLQVFVDEKPENYAFSTQTREMTGEDVFKQWSS